VTFETGFTYSIVTVFRYSIVTVETGFRYSIVTVVTCFTYSIVTVVTNFRYSIVTVPFQNYIHKVVMIIFNAGNFCNHLAQFIFPSVTGKLKD
jgi:hypothetical protein